MSDRPEWTSRPARGDRAVILCADRGAYTVTECVARRIVALEPEIDVVLCLDDPELPPKRLRDGTIRYARLAPDARIERFPDTSAISRATYHRLLLPGQFSADYRRILYVDGDIWVTRSGLSELFLADMKDTAVAAAPDIAALREPPEDLAMSYRNAGILLFDCLNGAAAAGSAALDFAEGNPGKLSQLDQSALNAALEGRMALLSPRWNFMYQPRTLRAMATVDPIVVHFAGASKPWNAGDNPSFAPFYPLFSDALREVFTQEELQDLGIWGRGRVEAPKHANPFRAALSRLNQRRKRAAERRGHVPHSFDLALVERFMKEADIP